MTLELMTPRNTIEHQHNIELSEPDERKLLYLCSKAITVLYIVLSHDGTCFLMLHISNVFILQLKWHGIKTILRFLQNFNIHLFLT